MDTVTIRPFRSAAVSKFEVVPLGVDVPDYFQGFGVAFTPYEHCATGIGNTEAEAYADACEQIAQALTSAQFQALGLPEKWGREEPDAIECFDAEEYEEAEACGVQWYVGIRYNV